jgi:hypothetical protein
MPWRGIDEHGFTYYAYVCPVCGLRAGWVTDTRARLVSHGRTIEPYEAGDDDTCHCGFDPEAFPDALPSLDEPASGESE